MAAMVGVVVVVVDFSIRIRFKKVFFNTCILIKYMGEKKAIHPYNPYALIEKHDV
jgi:hypothetical protein